MYLFLINPETGNRQFRRVETQMKRLLEECKIKYRFVMIDDLADVPNLLAAKLRTTDRGVVVVGGNATVNAAINALADRDLPLGIVPMSKTNHLAYGLGISNWRQAIRMLHAPNFKDERLGKIGKHYFVGKIEIASRQNLLAKYLGRTNPWLKFLGVIPIIQAEGSGVAMQMLVDDELKASGETKKMEITLNGTQNEKKLKVHLLMGDIPHTDTTLLRGNTLTIDSDKKMPVMMGNETIAYTPVEIKGLSKRIRLITPENSKSTAAAK